MKISDLGKQVITSEIKIINKQIEEIDNSLSPLVKERNALTERIEAINSRRNDLIKNKKILQDDTIGGV